MTDGPNVPRGSTSVPAVGRASVAMRPSQMLQALGDPSANEGAMRRAGGLLVKTLYAALRAVKMYPMANEQVTKAIEDLAQVTSEVLKGGKGMQLLLAGDAFLVNDVRLNLELQNLTAFTQVMGIFRTNGIGEISVDQPPLPRDYQVLLAQLQAVALVKGEPEARFEQLLQKLEQSGIRTFQFAPPRETGEARKSKSEAKEAAKRVYAQGIAVTKDVVNSARMGRSAGLKRVKRVVQTIVDQILTDETSLVGLTTIRDYDEYTFVHSLNVCIFSVALGRRLGLDKLQLYDLGMAALFHDIGKARISLDVLNKAEKLTDDEWRLLTTHTWRGLLILLSMKSVQDMPYRSMVVAYEHHMRTDLTGYPRHVRPREMSIFSKVVAVADGFDAATTQRAYANPVAPAVVLQEMRDNPKRGMDPIIVKAFVAMLGVYPVGTLVMLDTFELAVVMAANPDPEQASRPAVLIVSDAQGNVAYPGIEVDLSATDADGNFPKTIIKTENPERYGIRVGDYFR